MKSIVDRRRGEWGLIVVAGLALNAAWAGPREIPRPDAVIHPGHNEAPSSSPRTYPDETGFARRRDAVLQALTLQDLATYRRGYFSGGDPGKYLPGHAMARLIVNPGDPDAVRLMNDDRSYKEHYHFAAINWARFLPLFGDVLNPQVQSKLAEEAFRYGAYLNPGGTENHKTMWITSANVLPHYLAGDRGLSHLGRAQTLASAKEKLRQYVRGLYAAGAGEWDSPTYTMFTLHGLLNVYDFSPDEEARSIAKAGLDWITAYYALKFTQGLFCPPHQRGHYDQPWTSIADQTGYAWWGGPVQVDPQQASSWRYSIHALTSSYRPNAVTTRIALRQLPRLPVELRNSKPNYWYGLNQPPRPNVYQETLYVHPRFTMGSLWRGHGSQMSRLGIAVPTEQGTVLISAGHPRRSDHEGRKTDFGYADGTGRYMQSAQVGSTYLGMAQVPEEDPLDYCYVTLSPQAQVTAFESWLMWSAGGVTVAVRGIGSAAEVGATDLTDKQRQANEKDLAQGRSARHEPRPLLRIPGRRVGFLIEVLDTSDPQRAQALLAAASLDDARFAAEMQVHYRNVAGQRIEMAFNPDPADDRHADRHARVVVDGRAVSFDDWPVASGPYVHQVPGRLRVEDGQRGFEIEFTGDLPVYREWMSP